MTPSSHTIKHVNFSKIYGCLKNKSLLLVFIFSELKYLDKSKW